MSDDVRVRDDFREHRLNLQIDPEDGGYPVHILVTVKSRDVDAVERAMARMRKLLREEFP
jgi:hypothetical protein